MIKDQGPKTKYHISRTVLFCLGLFAGFLFFCSAPAKAATLYLDPATQTIGPDDTVEVKVKIGVGVDECINAAQIGVNFPTDILEVKDFNSGESFLSLWIVRPDKDSLGDVNSSGKIIFSGGIPGGYCGKIPGDPGDSNILGSIVFTPKKPILFHKAKVDFNSETQAFLNDGQGTVASLSIQGAVLEIDEKIKEKKDEWAAKISADNNPPEPFVVMIDNSQRIAGGKFFIVFSTVDKETGIDHYEVLEAPASQLEEKKTNVFGEFLRKIFKSEQVAAPAWKKAISPYILKDQSLNSVVRVKAIDRAGNERMVEFDNRGLETLKNSKAFNLRSLLTVAIVLFSIVVIVILTAVFWRRRR